MRSQGVISAGTSKDRSEFHRSCTTNTMLPIINATVFTKCLWLAKEMGKGKYTELV